MVPIPESDLGQGGWSKVEWENYELWEKIEVRLRRKKRLWIFATVVTFFALSAVPMAMDRWPKWMTRSIARALGQEVNRVKREACIAHAPYRIRLTDESNLNYVVEKVTACDRSSGELIRTGVLATGDWVKHYVWLSVSKSNTLGIPGLVSQFCYDPLTGSDLYKIGEPLAGFAISPVSDLTEKRLDRTTVLLVSGPFSEISFD
jgi:hypothetical protein